MLVRLSLLAALLSGSGLSACAQSAPATSDPAAARWTVAQVESTEFFRNYGFEFDKSLSDASVRTYRPFYGLWRKRLTLRLRATQAGDVSAVTLGVPVITRYPSMLVREALADLIHDILPRSDSVAAAPFVAQVRDNLAGASDTGFYDRSASDSLLPKRPTEAYMALIGATKAGAERIGASQVAVSRLIEKADTAVVMSVILTGDTVDPGVITDWIDTRHFDLLGATEAELASTELVLGLELLLRSRTARELRYNMGSTSDVLRVTLDSAARATRLVMLLPDMGSEASVSDRTMALASTLVTLVPRKDSVAMAQIRKSALLISDGTGAFDATRINEFVKGTTTDVTLHFTASSVRITRTGSGSDRMFVLEVGGPGSFATSTAPQPTRARRGTSP
jgi:hypothetical protein